MFDIGLDKIATVIIDKSANDFGDFFTKIKPKHTE